MRMPRLLPLVAIAAGGVLAINAIENGPGIVGAARSFAEGVAPKGGQQPAAGALPANASVAPTAAQAVAAKPAPVCAESPTELAKEAGLSPAELQVIQSLGARRGELDQREQGLSTELALIQAAEAKVDAKIATMNALKGDMQTMLGQLDAKQQAEVASLVKVYADMKPQAAAARFSLLTDDVRLPIAAQMKEQKLSAIIANMAPADAKHLTEALAARYVAQAAAARAAINPPPVKPAAASPAAATPSQPSVAQAATQPASPAQASPVAATGAPPKPKPAVHRKPKVAKPPAKSVAAAKPPEPVWPPKPAAGAAAPGAAGAKSAAASPPGKSAAAAPTPKPAGASPPAQPAAKSASGAPAPTPASAPAKSG
jgi:flagellar motility protein MotE (MotC chaperone)